VTLTYSVLYLSLYIHRANRKYQHTLLAQQSVLLNSVIEPLPPLPESPAYDVQKVNMAETLKDRWNGEVEGLVRRVQETDWNKVRARWESRIGTVWAKVRESEAGDRLREDVAGAGEEVKKAAETAQAHPSPEPKRLLEIK
jgi:altered-inheritance-of-mitochondria protein 5